MSRTLSTTISPNEPTELVPPPEIDCSTEQGGEGGGVSSPLESGGPAEANGARAHTSAQDKSNFLINDSPLTEVVTYSTGFAGRTPHDIAVDPASNALWRTYQTAGLFKKAAELARERYLCAETERERVCWLKDLALVKMAEGENQYAADILLGIRDRAKQFAGSFRGRIEAAFARVHERLGLFDPAFEFYTAGHFYAEQSGDHYTAAQIDTNTGRCYTDAGRPEDSYDYFDRAYRVALTSGDILLQAEIDESRALAMLAEGDYLSARQAATHSLYLLSGTGYELAYGETKRTIDRIDAALRGNR